MVTHLGIGTYTYAWNIAHMGFSRGDLMRKAASLGADVVQFCENLPLREEDLPEMGAFGLRLEVGTRGLEDAVLRAGIAMAARVGAPFLRLVIDSPGDEPTPREAIERLRPYVGEAARAGVKLAIENHDRFSSETLVEIVNALGRERVGVCLDTANSIGSLEGPCETVSLLAPYTLCLHVKDVRARRFPHQMGFVIEGTVAGEGALDIPWILQTLDAAGAVYSVILEQWPPIDDGLPLDREREMAEASFAYLRGMIR
ncbi:MAG: sugar phosphate isomerase/epimerase family protein [Fimbriimonas sp.]